MFHEYNLIYLEPLCICAKLREHHMLIEIVNLRSSAESASSFYSMGLSSVSTCCGRDVSPDERTTSVQT